MPEDSRRAMVLRLGLLFFGPLAVGLLFFVPAGNVESLVILGLLLYVGLLLGLGLWAAPTMVRGTGMGIVVGLALAVGMFLVHLFVAFAGCMAMVAVG